MRGFRSVGYKPSVIRQGPVPAFVHGAYEYVGGVALIVVPLLLDYKHGAATAVSVILGVLVLVLAAASASPTSLVNEIPLSVHVVLDYLLAAVLIAAPFLFGFSSEGAPTAVFVGAGVLHLMVSIGTRYRKDGEETPRRRERPAPRAVADEEIPEFEPPPP